jgi:hypothetical protein
MMTNGEQAPVKKGLPVWAWIGIGCGALFVFAAIIVTIGGFVIASKTKDLREDIKDFAADVEDDPQAAAMAGAKMLVRLNPELEEVSSDKEAGTMTIRVKETGEIITVNLDEITEGRLSFKTGDREVNIDASELDESGSLKITDEEGGVVFSTGEVSQDVPAWLPLYPGTEPANRHSMKTGKESMGGFELETTDGVDEVLKFYREKLESDGFEVSVNTFSQEDSQGGMVNGQNNAAGRSATVVINSEGGGPTKVVINFQQRAPEE